MEPSTRKTHDESDLLFSDDESTRRKVRSTTLPKEGWTMTTLKAASLSKAQLQQHQQKQKRYLFTKQQQKASLSLPPSSPQHSMKESILKDLRIALSESSEPHPPDSMTRSVSKLHQQSQPKAAKRVTSVPKLHSLTKSNSSSSRQKLRKKRKLPAKNSNQWTSVVSTSAWGSDHDSSQDDDDNDDNDARQINAGVYLLENTKTGHCYFGTTWDLKNAAAQNFFDLENSAHPHQALTRCFQLYGADASGIRYRVLERVAAPAPTSKVTLIADSQPQSRRIPDKQQSSDAFDVKKMETLLLRRLNFHRKKRIRKRTLQLVHRLMLFPFLQQYWPRWTQFAQDQQTLEYEAAATELQRVYRGRLGKKRALAVKKMRAAVHLQQFLRLCVVKCVLKRRKHAKLEHASASTIQRGVRSFLKWRELHKRQLMVKKWLQARRIQTCYRGYRGRRTALEIANLRAQNKACTLIQKAARGFLARKAARCRRSHLFRSRATVVIQKRWRGVLARSVFAIKKHLTSDYQRRHRAAAKIQSVYWRFLERKLRRVASQYTFQTQQAIAICMAYKNYVAKKFGWAAMTFMLETSMATRIQRCLKRWFFFHRMRQLIQRERYERAARAIQRMVRGKLGRRHFQIMKQLQRQVCAAKRIQLMWRSHKFLQQLQCAVVQWRRESSARRIQANYRRHHARQLYIVVRTQARREKAATMLQCLYRSRNARREWHRRLELKKLGACGDCGDQLALLYSFSFEMELCTRCWERCQRDIPKVLAFETLDVATYRRIKIQVVSAQRAYRTYQTKLAQTFGVCHFCEDKAIRKHCEACGSSKRFCHSCAAMFHRLKKGDDETLAPALVHVPISIEEFDVRERAAILIQKHFRRFRQCRTLLHLRRSIENAAAERIQRVYRPHRQHRITRALYVAQQRRQQDELHAAVVIQSYYRGHLAQQLRQQLAREWRSAICIQRVARGRKSKMIAQEMRQRRDAAIDIQRHLRGMRARNVANLKKQELLHTKQRRAAVCIQRHVRGRLARQLVLEMNRNAAALAVQLAWRSWKARCELKRRIHVRDKHRRELEEAIQKVKAAQEAEVDRKAATRIQTWIRQFLAKRGLLSLRLTRAREFRIKRQNQAIGLENASAVRIQQFVRAKWLDIASKHRLPAHCRARQFLSRRVLQRLRLEKYAALKIQRVFRRSRVKRTLESLAIGAAELSPWVELFDEASGYVYYYNTETMESSWEKPADFESNYLEQIANQQEEPEWLEYWDENVGASYFYNTKTGEATWTTPEGMDTEVYSAPEALDGNNQAPEGLYSPEMSGVFRTLPPKAKASMTRSRVLDNNGQVPEAMFQTAPAFRVSSNPSFPAYPSSAYDSNQDHSDANDAVDPYLYECAYEESAVDTEYDINYKIYMTQLERDAQQQQEDQQQEDEEDEQQQQDEPDDQQERQQE